MTETRLWMRLAIVCCILGIPQLLWAPARVGGVFFSMLAICSAGEWFFVKNKRKNRFCAIVAMLGRILFGLFIASFICIQGIILMGMYPDEQAKDADVLLVLGARVYESGQPSATLVARLDTAAAYLKEHPETIAVLCGGQGSNEPMPEAQAMFLYLQQAGIAPERLLLESASSNTIQNIANAHTMLDERFSAEYHTAVITSDFHLARARRLMLSAGLDPYGIPAPTPYFMQRIALHLREYGSIVGLMLTGRW